MCCAEVLCDGDVVHCGGDTGCDLYDKSGETNGNYAEHNLRDFIDFCKLKFAFFSEKVRKNDKECYELSATGCNSRALDTEVAGEHKEDVEEDVDHTAHDCRHGRDERFTVVSGKGS